jgi:hypothetical protein
MIAFRSLVIGAEVKPRIALITQSERSVKLQGRGLLTNERADSAPLPASAYGCALTGPAAPLTVHHANM